MKTKPDGFYHIDHNYISSPRRFESGLLHQIGRMGCSPKHEIHIHAHRNWFELTAVIGGRGEIITNGTPSSVEKGDIYVSFPGEFHGIVSDEKKPLEFLFFAFYPTKEHISNALESIMTRCASPLVRIFRDESVVRSIKDMLREFSAPDDYFEEQFSAMLSELQVYLIRNFAKVTEIRENDSEAKKFCYRLMNYVDTHIYTMETLNEISDAIHYNYSYLSTLFKRTMGETLQSYYSRRRLEAARLLLSENDLSVTEISELLHYSSIYTFSRAYKDHFGISPNKEKGRAI